MLPAGYVPARPAIANPVGKETHRASLLGRHRLRINNAFIAQAPPSAKGSGDPALF